MAGELLSIRGNLLQVPANQKLSKMLRGELFVLNYLYRREGEVHPKELSEKMAVSTARIARLLNHMEEKSLVIRQPDPGDSRQIIVQLTPAGAKAGEGARREVIAYLAKMLESLGPEDARAYIRIQEKIYQNYQK